MSIYQINILQNVLKILEIETEGHKILLYQGISSVTNILNTKYGTYQSMVDKEKCNLFPTDMEKITILQYWYQYIYSNRYNFTKTYTTNKSTETNGIEYLIPTLVMKPIINIQYIPNHDLYHK